MLDKLFAMEPAHIREGNTTLVSIWTKREIRRLVAAGVPQAQAEQQAQSAQPPATIDFRMHKQPCAL